MDVMYTQLAEEHHARLREEKGTISTQVLRNHQSVLNAYLAFCGKTSEYRVGREFTFDFIKKSAEFVEAVSSNKKTAADKLSILRAWQKTVDFVTQSQRLKATGSVSRFHQELRLAVAKTGLSVAVLAKKAVCDSVYVQKWLNGAYPYRPGFPTFRRLEAYLGFERGQLEALLPYPRNKNHAPAEIVGTASSGPVGVDKFAARHRENIKSRYFLPISEMTPAFLAEWQRFVAYKSAEFSVGLKRGKNSKWRLLQQEDAMQHAIMNPLSRTPSGLICPTAGRTSTFIRSYLGFLSKPTTDSKSPGLGLVRSEIQTLAMLVIPEFVNMYFEFVKERAGNVAHTGHSVFSSFIATLVRPEVGYLAQQPMFMNKIEAYANGRTWNELCAETLRVCQSWAEAGRGNKSRDPKVPLQTLLALDEPLKPFARAIKKLDEAAANQTPGSSQQAINKRDALLLAIAIANPLRQRTLTITKYVEPGKASAYQTNLYRTESGVWRLRFDRSAFKNGENKDADYDVPLPEALNVRIEEYLEEWRPILLKRNPDSPWLFPSRSGGKHSMLGIIILQIARNYIPEVSRMREHALRHVVATDFLRRNPGQYTVLAELLHDNLDTVLKTYSHGKRESAFNAHEESLKGFLSRI